MGPGVFGAPSKLTCEQTKANVSRSSSETSTDKRSGFYIVVVVAAMAADAAEGAGSSLHDFEMCRGVEVAETDVCRGGINKDAKNATNGARSAFGRRTDENIPLLSRRHLPSANGTTHSKRKPDTRSLPE